MLNKPEFIGFFELVLTEEGDLPKRVEAAKEILHLGLRSRGTDESRGCITHVAPDRNELKEIFTDPKAQFFQPIKKIILDSSTPTELRKALSATLSEWGGKEEAEFFGQLLSDQKQIQNESKESKEFFYSILQDLDVIGGPTASKILAEHALNSEGIKRRQALSCLERLSISPLGYEIGASLNREDVEILWFVRKKLEAIEQSQNSSLIDRSLARGIIRFVTVPLS